jgi:replicative DNA helicase
MLQVADSFAGQFDRLPPHSLEAEMCLVASLVLCDQALFMECRALVGREMFFQADHEILFDIIAKLRGDGRKVDWLIVREELSRRQMLEDIGGVAYLGQLASSVPSAAHALEYAKVVREKAVLREVIAAAHGAIQQAYAPSADDNAIEIAQATIQRLGESILAGADKSFHSIGDLMGEVYEQLQAGGVPMVKTGFTDLDEKTGGIGLGEEVIIAARPSMGKSTAVRQIAAQIAQSGVPVALFSREEGRHKIARNLLSTFSGVENNRIRRASLDEHEWHELAGTMGRFGKVPLYIVDDAWKMSDIASRLHVLVARHGVKVFILDYLQRVGGVEGKSAYERASAASLAVSDLIKKCNVAGLIVAQLNRGVEHREDRRPSMSDLRDSGQIEQDADGILFLHREDYYHLDDGNYTPTNEAELIVAKWRDGVRGQIVRLRSNLKTQMFENLTEPF